ncbi:MAG: histidine kinase N-terminal domain-containing protein, partial [Promicromonosporaceae bacterium]|nr:histidine kinase N-terminal domain-containing protein [Promicromonosporaceae bacterium]
MSDLISRHCDLPASDVEWLHLLIGDWQVVSDLAFADLVLWVPTREGSFISVAHCRPSTGATVYYEDIVGSVASEAQRELFEQARAQVQIQRPREPQWFGSFTVREEVVPVVR